MQPMSALVQDVERIKLFEPITKPELQPILSELAGGGDEPYLSVSSSSLGQLPALP